MRISTNSSSILSGSNSKPHLCLTGFQAPAVTATCLRSRTSLLILRTDRCRRRRCCCCCNQPAARRTVSSVTKRHILCLLHASIQQFEMSACDVVVAGYVQRCFAVLVAWMISLSASLNAARTGALLRTYSPLCGLYLAGKTCQNIDLLICPRAFHYSRISFIERRLPVTHL